MTISGHPVIAVKQEDGTLKVREVGHDQAKEDNVEQEDFLTHLRAYEGEWFRDNIQTPNGTECIVEAIKNGTQVYAIDGSYMKHLKWDISGVG